MDRTEIAMMLLVGGCAGVLSGMFGIGGGLIIVPVLIVMCDLDPKTAVGTSLFALLLPTGLLGVLEYWRRGELRFVPGLLIAFGIFCGAYLGGADHRQYVCLDHETCLRGLSDCRRDLLPLDQLPAVGEDAEPATASTAAPACRPGPGLSAGPLTA